MKKFLIRNIRKLLGTYQIILTQDSIISKLNENQKCLNEIYKAHLFKSTIENSPWLINKSFSPGRGAVDYSFFYVLYRVLNDFRPNKIIEFGLGQSTKMINQYAEFFKVQSITFEHDQEWMNFFNSTYKLSSYCKVDILQLETVHYKGFDTLRYKGDITKIAGTDNELIILDGPIGSYRYSRIQILDLIPTSLNKSNFIILLDDFERIGEKDTSTELLNILNTNNIPFLEFEFSGEKKQLVICSPNNSLLATI